MIRIVVASLGLVLFIACSGSPGSRTSAATVNQPSELQTVYRSGKSIVAAVETGTTEQNLYALVRSFAVDVSLANDAARTDSEKACASSYEWALGAYQDSLTAWAQAGRADENVQKLWRLAKSYIVQVNSTTWARGHFERGRSQHNRPVVD
jgi:hypothetical protein